MVQAVGRDYYVYDLDPMAGSPMKVGEARVTVIWNRAYLKITRTMNRKHQEFGRDTVLRYRGIVKHRQFILTFTQKHMPGRAGVCVLRSDSSGLILSGYELYYDDDAARHLNMELHLKSTRSRKRSPLPDIRQSDPALTT